LAISEAYTFSAVTVSGTELSFVSGTSSLQAIAVAGVYQLYVDAANMAKADEFRIKVKEKVLAGGTQRTLSQWSLLGVQTEAFVTPTLVLINGFDFTIIKIAGTDRAFSGSIRKIA
jgi:hypothetical protein